MCPTCIAVSPHSAVRRWRVRIVIAAHDCVSTDDSDPKLSIIDHQGPKIPIPLFQSEPSGDRPRRRRPRKMRADCFGLANGRHGVPPAGLLRWLCHLGAQVYSLSISFCLVMKQRINVVRQGFRQQILGKRVHGAVAFRPSLTPGTHDITCSR